MSARLRIAIIGGGPAGLTLGLLLHKRNIPFTIFELRQKPTDEELAKPSGMLDLHEESGLASIKECGLLDEFLNRKAECTEAQRVADKGGNILYKDEGELSERPEISRHALTKLLISQLPPDQIVWGHKLFTATGSTELDHMEVELDFGPHGKQTFDLVIGADGAWSKVRALLTDVKPRYDGTQNITLTMREVTNKYPHLSELVGTGSFSALGNQHGVMSQRGPQDSARIYIFLSTNDEHFADTNGLTGNPATAVPERLLSDVALLGTWGSIMKELVIVVCKEEEADNPGAAVDIRSMYALPIGHIWEHQVGATLIGDAAHLMGPWAGEGVNLAMWDSLLLAHAIGKSYEAAEKDVTSFQNALKPLVKEFEIEMVARCKEKAEESVQNREMMLSEDGAERFVNFFLAAYGDVEARPE